MMYLGGYCHVKFIAIVAKSLVIAIVAIYLIMSEYIGKHSLLKISSRNVWVTTLHWQNDYLNYQVCKIELAHKS
jgi:hypothetical protein